MLTTVDKMWVSGVVAFVSQYVLHQFFNVTLDPTIQAGIVAVLTALLTYIVPNKPKA